MTKREMEDRIVALEAQVRLLQGLLAQRTSQFVPQPMWQPTWQPPYYVTCEASQ